MPLPSVDRSRPIGPSGGWIVSPAFDLLFLANLPWVLVFIPPLVGIDGPLSFWQLYFLTTPHRWMTLLVVATDPDRREGRGPLFLVLAAAAMGVVTGTYLLTGDFACLVIADLVWNGWHFASQHAGVLRIYGRKVGGGWAWLERYGTRAFVFYVALRAPAFATGYLRTFPDLFTTVRILDLVVLMIPVVLVVVQFRRFTPSRVGKTVYVLSVSALYSSLLFAVRAEDGPLLLALSLGSALFHATEYLAIVTHYAWRRRLEGGGGGFRTMAANWGLVLVTFAVVVGLFAATWETSLGDLWVGANLAAAFLHYAYDGMIWKLRRPATARVLGLNAAPTG